MLTIQNYNNHDTNATTPTIAGTKKCHNRHDCHYEYRHTTAMLQVQTLPLPLPVLLRPSTSSRSASPDPTTTTTEATTTTTAAIYYCFHHHYCRSLSLLRAYYQLQLLALLRRPPVRRCCSFNGLLLPCSLWLWSLLIVCQELLCSLWTQRRRPWFPGRSLCPPRPTPTARLPWARQQGPVPVVMAR